LALHREEIEAKRKEQAAVKRQKKAEEAKNNPKPEPEEEEEDEMDDRADLCLEVASQIGSLVNKLKKCSRTKKVVPRKRG
jgi:hypothetical protein